MPGLRVSVSEPRMVSMSMFPAHVGAIDEGGLSPPRPLIRAADGGLLLTVGVGPDATFQQPTSPNSVLLRSDDDAETWYRVREFYAYEGHMLMDLPNGTVHAPSYCITYKERSGSFLSSIMSLPITGGPLPDHTRP